MARRSSRYEHFRGLSAARLRAWRETGDGDLAGRRAQRAALPVRSQAGVVRAEREGTRACDPRAREGRNFVQQKARTLRKGTPVSRCQRQLQASLRRKVTNEDSPRGPAQADSSHRQSAALQPRSIQRKPKGLDRTVRKRTVKLRATAPDFRRADRTWQGPRVTCSGRRPHPRCLATKPGLPCWGPLPVCARPCEREQGRSSDRRRWLGRVHRSGRTCAARH